MNNVQQRRISIFFLFVVALIWGGGYLGVEGAIRAGFPPSFILAVRFLIGAAMIYVFCAGRIKAGKSLSSGILAGVVVYAGFYMQTVGQVQSAISVTAFLTATNVVMIPFVQWVFHKKKPENKVFFCCALTLFGVGMISYIPGERFSLGPGGLLIVLGAFLFSLHIVYLGHSVQKADAASVTFWQLLTAGVVGAVLFFVSGQPLTLPMMQKGIWSILYVGIFATGICYYFQGRAQKHLSAAQTGIILSLEGVFGAIFSIIFGMEPFKLTIILGGLVITASVILMEIGAKPEPNVLLEEVEGK